MGNITHDKSDLAEIISSMPFGELVRVAKEFVDMVATADGCRDLTTAFGMAEMLSDWAEAQIDP